MKLIIFTTCKEFIGDDAWRQEQAIKSWTLLEGIEKKIIVLGNDKGTKEICDKYKLIHEPNIKTLYNVPYLHEMFVIANTYADDDDIMMWTNSDMIYFQDMITNILEFKKERPNEKNYMLVGQRYDWYNPIILENIKKESFINNMNIRTSPNRRAGIQIKYTDSSKYECNLHAVTGVDFIIHSKTTIVNNIDPSLVIAGTGHDLIMLGMGVAKNYYTCNITESCLVIHQNHAYKLRKELNEKLKNNNTKCRNYSQRYFRFINRCLYKTIIDNDTIKFVKQ